MTAIYQGNRACLDRPQSQLDSCLRIVNLTAKLDWLITCSIFYRFKVIAANNDIWRCKTGKRFPNLFDKIMAQVN